MLSFNTQLQKSISMQLSWILFSSFIVIVCRNSDVSAFVLPSTTTITPTTTTITSYKQRNNNNIPSRLVPSHQCRHFDLASSKTKRQNTKNSNNSSNNNNNNNYGTNKKKTTIKRITIKDLQKQFEKNPALMDTSASTPSKKKRSRRTRKRVQNPKQSYVYASQRNNPNSDNTITTTSSSTSDHPIQLAKQYGLTNPKGQHCDPLVDDIEPEILGQVRVVEQGEGTSEAASFAYVIYKPAGWCILGGGEKKKKPIIANKGVQNKQDNNNNNNIAPTKQQQQQEVKTINADDFVEYNEEDMLALLTPEERLELEQEWSSMDESSKKRSKKKRRVKAREDDDEELDLEELAMLGLLTDDERLEYEAKFGNNKDMEVIMGENDEFDESDILALLTPEERIEYEQEMNGQGMANEDNEEEEESLESSFLTDAASYTRPSVVNWLKELKLEQGTPIRGGKYWKAIAGAVDVDDSGLLVLCPKEFANNVFIDYMEYVAVVGNGQFLAPHKKKKKNKKQTNLIADDDDDDEEEDIATNTNNNNIKMNILSKLRKGRGNDPVQTISVFISEPAVQEVGDDDYSTCESIVPTIQEQFLDGIRGDPMANPFDRRASRRLLHCHALSLSSLVVDESTEIDLGKDNDKDDDDDEDDGAASGLPDDIAIYAQRTSARQYQFGSHLGRLSLKENPLTTAYREINGAGDGYPNWIVDRYDKWLLVQYQKTSDYIETEFEDIVPSIHDGNTAGIYYIQNDADRSAMGSATTEISSSSSLVRPILKEGQKAPTISFSTSEESDGSNLDGLFPIVENGIAYLVSLDKDLSTGLFLDQRYQRAWLTRYCTSKTRILNCFAHCGGYSIAAAKAGASTVSIDLSNKWLTRIPLQLQQNGIDVGDNDDNNFRQKRHDCIYGDVFDWLTKLNKRREKYDIVILDPPSSSVGGGPKNKRKGNKAKRRWSVKQDMPELVSLACKLVKKGGYLWTTTNNASILPTSFAKLCYKGFDIASVTPTFTGKKSKHDNDNDVNFKLERVQPMPHDFPSIGPQPVKNFIWRRI